MSSISGLLVLEGDLTSFGAEDGIALGVFRRPYFAPRGVY